YVTGVQTCAPPSSRRPRRGRNPDRCSGSGPHRGDARSRTDSRSVRLLPRGRSALPARSVRMDSADHLDHGRSGPRRILRRAGEDDGHARRTHFTADLAAAAHGIRWDRRGVHGALPDPRSADESGLSEAIVLAVETSSWKVLERVWARRSVNVFVDVPTATDAYLGVPEDVLTGSPVLTLARSAARRIDSTRRRLHSDDVA